jgi:hypothetical protein
VNKSVSNRLFELAEFRSLSDSTENVHAITLPAGEEQLAAV